MQLVQRKQIQPQDFGPVVLVLVEGLSQVCTATQAVHDNNGLAETADRSLLDD